MSIKHTCIALTALAFAAGTIAPAQAEPISCTVKLREAIPKREERKKTVNKVVAGSGTTSVILSVFAPIPAGGTLAASAITALIFNIAYSNAKSALALFEEAAKGEGPHIQKLWVKFVKKYPDEAKEIPYATFVERIHQSDVDGTACKHRVVPRKARLIKLAL